MRVINVISYWITSAVKENRQQITLTVPNLAIKYATTRKILRESVISTQAGGSVKKVIDAKELFGKTVCNSSGVGVYSPAPSFFRELKHL